MLAANAEVLIGQLVGAAVALPSSRLSDNFGCKPMVYASCSLLCAPWLYTVANLMSFKLLSDRICQ